MRLTSFFLAWALLTSSAFAAPVTNVQSTICSGTETWNLAGPLSLSCSGDLSLNGGIFSDSSSIILSSTGSLTLDNLTVSAPQIQFSAGTAVSFGSGVSLTGTTISIATDSNGVAPIVSIAPGATISVAGSTALIPLDSNVLILSPPNNGNLTITPGGQVTLTPVPLPSSYASMLVGLLAIVGFQFASPRWA